MKTELYIEQQNQLPKTGKQIIAQIQGRDIIVYQAYKPSIAIPSGICFRDHHW